MPIIATLQNFLSNPYICRNRMSCYMENMAQDYSPKSLLHNDRINLG